MRRRGGIFCFVFIFLIGITSAAVVCSDSSQIIMKLSSTSNAHGALWNDANYDGFEICYDTIFGVSYDGNENVVLNTNPTGVVTLMEGWNLVSFPTINPVPVTYLQSTCSINVIHHFTGGNFGEYPLFTGDFLERGKGYWVYNNGANCDLDLTQYGLASNVAVTLEEGWNLVGGTDGAMETGYSKAVLMYGWDMVAEDYALVSGNGDSQKGYWIDWDGGLRPTTCENPILSLTGTTNAHAEDGSLNTAGYDVDVCYADLSCTIRSGSCDSLSEEQCIVTLSDTTNAHLAKCGSSGYDLNLCCIPSEVTSCTPQVTEKFCADKGYQCGAWEGYDPDTVTGCPGVTHDCDTVIGGGCNYLSESCDLSNGQCVAGERREWTTTDDPTQLLTEIDVKIDGGEILMNLREAGIPLSDEGIKFHISHDGIELRTITSADVTDSDHVSATWTIAPNDIIDTEGIPFFFTVAGDDSGPLQINVLDQCFDVWGCKNYNDKLNCNLDLCGVGDDSVELDNLNIECGEDNGGHSYNCGCTWDDYPAEGVANCSPTYSREDDDIGIPEFKPEWQGLCIFSETTLDNCEDDFLTYSWFGTWEPSEIKPGLIGDDFNDGYYDPLNSDGIPESKSCEQSYGAKTVPCPSQIKLPLFGFWQILASLSLIAFIYVVMVFRKEE